MRGEGDLKTENPLNKTLLDCCSNDLAKPQTRNTPSPPPISRFARNLNPQAELKDARSGLLYLLFTSAWGSWSTRMGSVFRIGHHLGMVAVLNLSLRHKSYQPSKPTLWSARLLCGHIYIQSRGISWTMKNSMNLRFVFARLRLEDIGRERLWVAIDKRKPSALNLDH